MRITGEPAHPLALASGPPWWAAAGRQSVLPGQSERR